MALSAKRPPTGRIQTRVRRLLIAHGWMTTPQLMRAIYPCPTQHWHYGSVRDAARKFAVEDRRQRSRGEPIIWRLK
jgi:hypothetical protein